MNTESDANEEKGSNTAKVEGSGAIAQDGGVAAGWGGVAVGRDVYGDIHIGDKVYTRSQVEELHDFLARAVAEYERRMYQLVAHPLSSPKQPYKFLYAFEVEDADIFFGRDAATEELFKTVLKDRLTVLHAKSGAGKTSLLNAGLSPRLIREGYLPVYARAYDDPVRAIKRAIAPPSLGQWPELLDRLTLQEFLGQIHGHLSRQIRKLVIILDQFEEFFVFWPEAGHRQPFIDALADSYDDKSVPVHFVIGIRGDYFTYLATLQHRLPSIFHNEYYLDAMTREDAQEALTRPVAKLGLPVTYEQALLDTLLDDLARGGMELPHLQIICTRLFETLTEGKTTITLTAYEELGRAEGVLGGYLTEVLERLPGKGEDIAKEVLKELVSSEATKRVLSYDTLVGRVGVEDDELDAVLARLVDARLLHRAEVAGEIVYEMAHEYIIDEIRSWMDKADLAFKQAEELLAREVANWRVHRTLIPKERLELLHPHRERLRVLDGETQECLLRSALQVEFAIGDWAEVAGEAGVDLLIGALKNQDVSVRAAAIRALRVIGDSRAVQPLVAVLHGDWDPDLRGLAITALGKIGDPQALKPLMRALRDADKPRRQAASNALAQLGEPAVEPLIEALRDTDSHTRNLAAESLGQIGDPRALEPLVAALGDESTQVRAAAARSLGEMGDSRAVKPLIARLGQEQYDYVRGMSVGYGFEPDVRRAIIEALEKIGTPEALAALEESR